VLNTSPPEITMNRTILLAIIGVVSYLIVLIPGYFFLPQGTGDTMEEIGDPSMESVDGLSAEDLVLPPSDAPVLAAPPVKQAVTGGALR
jgi:hypothetical protein